MRWLAHNWHLPAAALAASLAGAAVVIVLGSRQESHEESRPAQNEIWREIAWPFGRDAWPPGRAFRCLSPRCGAGTEVYVRAKIGFCANCEIGVADDAEVDRVTDLDLLTERFAALAAGGPIRLSDMAGRARRYELTMPQGATRRATGLAVSRGCDLVVAAVLWPSTGAPDIELAAKELLSSAKLSGWMIAALSSN